MDPEAERPQNYVELLSGDDSWKNVGLRIKWTEPIVPGETRVSSKQPVRLRLCVESKRELQVPPEEITAWCWTPIITADHPSGIWQEIELKYNPKCTQWDDDGITLYVFQGSAIPERDDCYRITFNVKYKQFMIWNNKFQKDNFLEVAEKPCIATQTIIYPKIHFTSNFSSGKERLCEPAPYPVKGPNTKEDLEMLVML